MGWSWRLGRIAGIDVFVHFTFLLLVGYIGLSHYLVSRDVGDAALGVAFILALFAIIVLHELGHALAARRYGIATRDITLLPIGGVARLERMPDDPKQELVVALAGPAVNVVIAAAIYVGLSLGPGLIAPTEAVRVGAGFLQQMLWVNVVLVVFNMLPAFPMDGGRVLRALLAMRMDYVRATHLAAGIGQGMAILFAFVGLFSPFPLLLFVALFVWVGASQEANMVQLRTALAGIPVMRAMITDFKALAADDSLGTAAEHVLSGSQQDFPVVDDGRVVGVLTRNDLVSALSSRGPTTPVRDAMQREYATTDPREMLERAFERLQECHCHTLPVLHNGELVGLLTSENVTEALMIQEALRVLQQRGGRGGNLDPRGLSSR